MSSVGYINYQMPNAGSNSIVVRNSELNWANELREKSQKGYHPTSAELIKYQDIANRTQLVKSVGGYVYKDEVVLNHSSKLAQISSVASKAISGAAVGYLYGADIATTAKGTFDAIQAGGGIGNFSNTVKEVWNGIKLSGTTVLKATGVSALISGGVSAVSNAIALLTGKVTKGEAAGNIASDLVGGLFTGVGAIGIGGLSLLAFSSFGIAGLPLTILAVGASAIGAVLFDKIYKGTGLSNIIKDKITGLLK